MIRKILKSQILRKVNKNEISYASVAFEPCRTIEATSTWQSDGKSSSVKIGRPLGRNGIVQYFSRRYSFRNSQGMKFVIYESDEKSVYVVMIYKENKRVNNVSCRNVQTKSSKTLLWQASCQNSNDLE